jgi:hypothetical protein
MGHPQVLVWEAIEKKIQEHRPFEAPLEDQGKQAKPFEAQGKQE